MLKEGQIVYCNLTVLKKDKEVELKEVVYKDRDGYYKGDKVLKVDVIKTLGYARKSKEYQTAKKSSESRNTTTGVYE